MEYDRALEWRACPWREQINGARREDLAILGGLMRQAYGY